MKHARILVSQQFEALRTTECILKFVHENEITNILINR